MQYLFKIIFEWFFGAPHFFCRFLSRFPKFSLTLGFSPVGCPAKKRAVLTASRTEKTVETVSFFTALAPG